MTSPSSSDLRHMYSVITRAILIVGAAGLSLTAQQPARSQQPTPPPQRRDSTTDTTARGGGGGGGGGALGGLRFRSIGPALTSGRIGDIAVHPRDHKIWYVAVSSGGL